MTPAEVVFQEIRYVGSAKYFAHTLRVAALPIAIGSSGGNATPSAV